MLGIAFVGCIAVQKVWAKAVSYLEEKPDLRPKVTLQVTATVLLFERLCPPSVWESNKLCTSSRHSNHYNFVPPKVTTYNIVLLSEKLNNFCLHQKVFLTFRTCTVQPLYFLSPSYSTGINMNKKHNFRSSQKECIKPWLLKNLLPLMLWMQVQHRDGVRTTETPSGTARSV